MSQSRSYNLNRLLSARNANVSLISAVKRPGLSANACLKFEIPTSALHSIPARLSSVNRAGEKSTGAWLTNVYLPSLQAFRTRLNFGRLPFTLSAPLRVRGSNGSRGTHGASSLRWSHRVQSRSERWTLLSILRPPALRSYSSISRPRPTGPYSKSAAVSNECHD